MLLILDHTARFQDLAALLAHLTIELRDVRSCTFPSRPEPKSARWVSLCEGFEQIEWLQYHFEPEYALRTLWEVRPCAEVGLHLDSSLSQWCTRQHPRTGEDPLFASWPTLRDALISGDHTATRRAAAAWRRRGACAPSGEATEAAAVLAQGLEGAQVSTRRACAEQLTHWSHEETRLALKRACDDEDLTVRVWAKRALTRFDDRQFMRL